MAIPGAPFCFPSEQPSNTNVPCLHLTLSKGASMNGSDSQWIPALLSSSVYKTPCSCFHILSLCKCYAKFDDPVSKRKIIPVTIPNPQHLDKISTRLESLESTNWWFGDKLTKRPWLPLQTQLDTLLVLLNVRSPGQGGLLAMVSNPSRASEWSLGRIGRKGGPGHVKALWLLNMKSYTYSGW